MGARTENAMAPSLLLADGLDNLSNTKRNTELLNITMESCVASGMTSYKPETQMDRSGSSIHSAAIEHHWLMPVLKKRMHVSHNAHPDAQVAKSLSEIRMQYITLAIGLGINGSLEHRLLEEYAPKKGYS